MGRNREPPHRVLLCMPSGEDRRLLESWLDDQERYEVRAATDGLPDEAFDLCVLHPETVRPVASALAERRAATDVFLPTILVVPERLASRVDDVYAALPEAAEGVVDEIINTPLRQYELERRLDLLLDARDRSRDLAASRERYRRLIELMPEAVVLVEDGIVTYGNEAAADLLVGDGDELDGRAFLSFVDPDDRPAVAREIHGRRSASGFLEAGVVAGGRRSIPCELAAAPAGGGDGETQVVVRDLSRQKEREREAREARAQLERTFERITDGFLALDDEWTVTYVNEQGARFLGFEPENLEGHSFWSVFPEAVGSRFEEKYEHAMASQEPVSFEEFYEPLESWFAVHAYPSPDGLSIFFRDVTDRKEMEIDLRETSRTLDAIFETSPTGIVVHDTDGDVVRTNRRARGLLGLDADELAKRSATSEAWDLRDPDGDRLPESRLPFVRALRREEPVFGQVVQLRRGDGERVWLSVNAAPLLDDAGEVTHVVNTFEDVTDRRERERQLERYETMVQTAGDAICTVDDRWRFTSVNASMASLTGYDVERLEGAPVSTVVPDDDADRLEGYVRELREVDPDGTRTTEVTVERTDGELRRCEVSVALLPGESFDGIVAIVRDVTDRQEREQRLSVLDRILRHNLRNRMNVVLGLASDLAEDHPAAERIVTASEDLLSVTEKVRRFHRAYSDPAATTQDLCPLVERVLAEARRSSPDVDLVVDLPPSAPARTGPAAELALTELVENAIEHNDRETPRVEVTVDAPADGEWVEVTVADDGPPIPPVERRVLETGVETALNHASGVGLWIATWAVRRAGGEVAYREREPRGNAVTLRFRRC